MNEIASSPEYGLLAMTGNFHFKKFDGRRALLAIKFFKIPYIFGKY